MTRDIVPAADAYDFSKYQPGDVIIISMHEIRGRSQTAWTLMIMAITNAAVRAGLDWDLKRDDAKDEIVIEFKPWRAQWPA